MCGGVHGDSTAFVDWLPAEGRLSYRTGVNDHIVRAESANPSG